MLQREREDRPELKGAKHHPENFRPVRAGGAPVTYRLRFDKVGAAALLGHLDLIRELPRVMRRAALRTAYSEGFHPKAEMSFGPALSLGVASLDEYVDVKLVDPPSPEEVLERLQTAASGGLRFTASAALAHKDPTLAAIVTGGRYVVALPESALDELGGRAGLAALVEAFVAKSELKLRRNVDGIGKLVDVRALTRSLELGDDSAHEALERAGVIGRVVPLFASMVISPKGSAKISELVEAIVGRPGFPFQAVRVSLLTENGTPLEVERHRKRPAAPAPQPEQPEASA